MKRGVFIVLDGNDGSGKATQTRLLGEYLAQQGRAYEKLDFPGYDANFFGAFIGECLAGTHGDFLHLDPKIASTLYALDRFESSPRIRAALAEGKIVIADRFSSSNQIHQGGKIADEEERTGFLAWLDRMEHEVMGIPRPDAVIYLRVPATTSLELLSQERAKKNGALGETAADVVESDRTYLERSSATADWLAASQANWQVVECSKDGSLRSREDIHEEVVRVVSARL